MYSSFESVLELPVHVDTLHISELLSMVNIYYIANLLLDNEKQDNIL